MSNDDWVSFSLRHGLVETCDALLTSIKYWKEEFFFVSSTAFDGPMVYGATADRTAYPSSDLAPEEQSTMNLLLENFVKWTDAEEIMLGVASMSSYWKFFGRKPMETLACHEVTLLEQLHRKHLASYALVTEEATIPNSPSQLESSMDSMMHITGQDMNLPVIPSPSKKYCENIIRQ
ncbi:unnamed protein product [Lactuca virosa]|uniref:Uncharacterized protein n=1 Tax=Lactuca virosa TaxID=75947 RepID=A0AAU9M5I2_9ASTR|nr:unnamed protein product [Lactuca virosa]